MAENTALLAITMGDPAGCGPEIIAKAAEITMDKPVRLVCIGDYAVMCRAIEIVDANIKAIPIYSIDNAQFKPGYLPILDLKNVDLNKLRWGAVQAIAGNAAYEYIIQGIDLALDGKIDAVVTSPINKEAMHLAGHKFDGHTELFAKRTNTADVTMMLASQHFRVTHVSTHLSLRDALDRCTRERIKKVIQLTNEGLQQLGISNPRLAVAGLNPHSSEGGVFGREEFDIIQPAIDDAIADGYNVCSYPVPGDTVFVRMWEGKEFDAVIAQYHDQGHIAAKLIDFWGGVNITLGLPIIRTSVDHGTAFDIAGKGVAKPISLVNAIEFAETLNINRFSPETHSI